MLATLTVIVKILLAHFKVPLIICSTEQQLIKNYADFRSQSDKFSRLGGSCSLYQRADVFHKTEALMHVTCFHLVSAFLVVGLVTFSCHAELIDWFSMPAGSDLNLRCSVISLTGPLW